MSEPLFRNTGLNYASIHDEISRDLAIATANRRRAAISLAEFLLSTLAHSGVVTAEAQDSLCRATDRLHANILDEERARTRQALACTQESNTQQKVPDRARQAS